MKFFIFVALLIISITAQAGNMSATWTRPIDHFSIAVPSGFLITEYRVKCTRTEDASVFVRVAPGYFTEEFTWTDVPEGEATCVVVAYSAQSMTESLESAPVTAIIVDTVFPNAPTLFNFTSVITGTISITVNQE